MHSEHFSEKEMSCPCCGLNICKPLLFTVLERIRFLAGCPISVTSGCRCKAHNKAEGGAENSKHPLGEAADIYAESLSAAALEAIARTIPEIHGFGRCDDGKFLHVDIRPAPIAQWCYGPRDTKGHRPTILYYPAVAA